MRGLPQLQRRVLLIANHPEHPKYAGEVDRKLRNRLLSSLGLLEAPCFRLLVAPRRDEGHARLAEYGTKTRSSEPIVEGAMNRWVCS